MLHSITSLAFIANLQSLITIYSFSRYLPTAKNQNQFFTVPGVHLSNVDCSQKHCDATLDKLASSSTSGAYKCEVSLDAPTFRVAFETKNVTVAGM